MLKPNITSYDDVGVLVRGRGNPVKSRDAFFEQIFLVFQDLERVRLLCELIRKREQRKREMVLVDADIKFLELNPFNYFLGKLVDVLQVSLAFF